MYDIARCMGLVHLRYFSSSGPPNRSRPVSPPGLSGVRVLRLPPLNGNDQRPSRRPVASRRTGAERRRTGVKFWGLAFYFFSVRALFSSSFALGKDEKFWGRKRRKNNTFLRINEVHIGVRGCTSYCITAWYTLAVTDGCPVERGVNYSDRRRR